MRRLRIFFFLALVVVCGLSFVAWFGTMINQLRQEQVERSASKAVVK
jgi:hypothetical protein